MMVKHNWPGTKRALRLVPMSEEEVEREVAANRSRFDWHAAPEYTRESDKRKPIPVGGGVLRGLWLVVRDTWRYLAGPSAMVHKGRRR